MGQEKVAHEAGLDEERIASAWSSNEAAPNSDDSFNYLSGWRLHATTAGLGIALFLINFEITIVSTALVSITDELKNFGQSSWIVTAYLCTYIAGLVIWAKLSDLFGRKPSCFICLAIFAAFSGGCGAAQTMIQLVVCRAFQGIGGSGIYSIGITMMYELVPQHRYPLYTGIVTILIVLSFALGPVCGGLISRGGGSWRWVFLLNLPCSAVAGALLLAVPWDFPHQGRRPDHPAKEKLSTGGLASLDITGSLLMIAALALLVSGFDEAASLLSWTAPAVLGPLCASAVAWVGFLISQWHASRPHSRIEPLLPWWFLRDRVMMGLLLNSLATGAVNITCIFQLPLRFQTAAGLTPLQAGLRLVPFSVSGPVGTMACAVLSKNRRVPPLYLAIVGAVLQILGLVFLSRGDPSDPEWPGVYGFEVLIGLGFGCCIGTVTLLCPFIVSKRDLAVGTAATVQARFLGSSVAISVITAVGNRWVRDSLEGILTPAQLQEVFLSTQTIKALPDNVQAVVRGNFVLSFNLQMRIVLGFAAASVLTSLMMWQRKQIRIP